MKKRMLVIFCLILLVGLFAAPALAQTVTAPAATDWYAIQESYDPTQTRAEFKDGRIVVNSLIDSKEPGAAQIIYTQPVDLRNFEVTFSLDQYTPCNDQYIAIGFINKGTDLHLGAGALIDPNFCLLLRPTGVPTVIDCAQGVLSNYDAERDMLRVGKSSFVPGFYFEEDTPAPWSNVIFKVCESGVGGYDVYINGRRVNNQNTWWFVDAIEAKTGSDDWYFYIEFKDGDYNPAQFTVKTVNGQPAVDPAVSGILQNSLLAEGETYAAVGGLLGDYIGVTAPVVTTTTTTVPTTVPTTGKAPDKTAAPAATTTTRSPATTKGTSGSRTVAQTTTAADTTENTTAGSETTGVTTTGPLATSDTGSTAVPLPAEASVEDKGDGDPSWMRWVGIGALVIAAGVFAFALVMYKKRA